MTHTRNTAQRDAIRDSFAETEGPMSAREVLDRAQEAVPSLGIATVYRHLKTLSEEGWLTAVELPGEATRYERADLHHHHHFKCDECDRVFDIPVQHHGVCHATLEGFDVKHHEVVLYGTCPECTDEE